MGCDIHLHTEIKINNRWHHYSACNVSRVYGLFAKMANVRNYNEIKPICERKGLPKNISIVTKIDFQGDEPDAHSMSWLSSDEVIELYNWIKSVKDLDWFKTHDEFGYLFGNSWNGFRKYPADYPEAIEDFRFVFWFDN